MGRRPGAFAAIASCHVSAAVGFVGLSGVAVLNGDSAVSYFNDCTDKAAPSSLP